MSKSPKTSESTTQEEAFEIIELATGDLETLARAFDVIQEVCEELNDPAIRFDNVPPEYLVN